VSAPAESPVFVGGTGRSGTHVLARLLDRHPQLASVPIEARFHCNKRGMPDLLGGRISVAGYLEKLREFWWHRVRVDGQPRGLYNLMPRSRLDAAIGTFEPAYRTDPVGACRSLFVDLLGPWAEEAGKPRLVEMSSHNIREAQTLLRLFPDARLVHAVRDGRDAASSVTTKTWGPEDLMDAIRWWADRLRAIEQGVRGEEDGAAYALGERLRVVILDELVDGDRDEAYAGLLGHLGVDDAPEMRSFFDTEMSAETANRGRWARGLGALAKRRVRRRYERTLSELEREGNHVAAPLLAAYEKHG
jgi:sulfotransferase family protein